jgi:hypothetical protein
VSFQLLPPQTNWFCVHAASSLIQLCE